MILVKLSSLHNTAAASTPLNLAVLRHFASAVSLVCADTADPPGTFFFCRVVAARRRRAVHRAPRFPGVTRPGAGRRLVHGPRLRQLAVAVALAGSRPGRERAVATIWYICWFICCLYLRSFTRKIASVLPLAVTVLEAFPLIFHDFRAVAVEVRAPAALPVTVTELALYTRQITTHVPCASCTEKGYSKQKQFGEHLGEK